MFKKYHLTLYKCSLYSDLPDIVHEGVVENGLGMFDKQGRFTREAGGVEAEGARRDRLHAELPAEAVQFDFGIGL